MLRACTLNAAAHTRVIHCRRTDTALPLITPTPLPRNAEPTIEIRDLRIYATRSSETGTGLKFYTAHDANVAALRAGPRPSGRKSAGSARPVCARRYKITSARKSLTLVCVGPVTNRSPIASK